MRTRFRHAWLGAAGPLLLIASSAVAELLTTESAARLLTGDASRIWVHEKTVQTMGAGNSCVSGRQYEFRQNRLLDITECIGGELRRSQHQWSLEQESEIDTALVVDGAKRYLIRFKDDGTELRLRSVQNAKTSPDIDMLFILGGD
ncbi:MAG TPA: hypothetical protein VEL28_04675 [Candidatus Binatia bacterium]|nr:hypothetical protein [Candidatus Binatia bacterium]